MSRVKFIRTKQNHYFNANKTWVDKRGVKHESGEIIEFDDHYQVHEDVGVLRISKENTLQVEYYDDDEGQPLSNANSANPSDSTRRG